MKNVLAKVSTAASTAMVSSWLLIDSAFAKLPDAPTVGGLSGGTDAASIKDTIVRLLEQILDFITLIGVVYVVVAGIRLILSGGDEGEKDKAKKTIIYVIIGIVVVLFARVIVSFVNSVFSS